MSFDLTKNTVQGNSARLPNGPVSNGENNYLPTREIKSDFSHFNIQTKLTVGSSDDPYEREADTMADRIMRMAEPNFIQRKCAECEKEEELHRMPISQATTPFLQAKNETIVSANVTTSIQSSKGGGSAMGADINSFMSTRFGHDFSSIKIHTDSRAIQLNRDLNAKAFTVGNDVYFNQGQYQPQSFEGKKLLAHELTHTLQQGNGSGDLSTSAIQMQEDPRVEAIREKLRQGGELTEEDITYLKKQIGQEIVQQLLGGAGQITINYDPSREAEDINRRFQGRLELRTSGLIGAAASSLEGTATADIDLVATVATEKAVITVSPPTERNRMAAMIRQLLFPNDAPRSFDFDFPEKYFKYANSIWLISGISISLSAIDMKSSGGMIAIHHESIPKGVELIMTLAPSARSTSVDETQRDVPGNHWILTPNPRIFGTMGYGKSLGSDAFTGTIGADLPLFYDTENPFIYGGLGVRGAIDTNTFGRAGGTAFLGLNFDPLTLQAGFGTGAAFLPKPVMTGDGPAQTVLYHEIEGMAAYKILPNMELMLLLSAGGGKNLPAYGTAQGGLGYRF